MKHSLNDLPEALLETDIPGFPKRQGKVRDSYDLGDSLLMVATDRISTFDVVHPNGIPEKGKILNAMTLFWFKKLKELIPDLEHHLISSDVSQYGHGLEQYAAQLDGRSMLVKKASVFPVECIVRGYITGSGWKDYQKNGAICGIELPAGLKQCEKFDRPLFTPSTKEDVGHDMNISVADAGERIGADVIRRLGDMSIEVYSKAAEVARDAGIIIADTKFEWGEQNGGILLIDEVLTPDSSRFWPMDGYKPGQDQPSFDKQPVRNYAETLGWNKKAPGPALPEQVVLQTRDRYIEAHDRLTGKKFAA